MTSETTTDAYLRGYAEGYRKCKAEGAPKSEPVRQMVAATKMSAATESWFRGYVRALLTVQIGRPHFAVYKTQAQHVARWYAEHRQGQQFSWLDREAYIAHRLAAGKVRHTASNEWYLVHNWQRDGGPAAQPDSAGAVELELLS